MSGALLGLLASHQGAAGGGGGNVAFVSLYNTGANANTNSVVTSASHSYTSGNLAVFPVRWGQGSGGTTRTLSTVTCSTGETPQLVGSSQDAPVTAWTQWVVCKLTTSGARTFQATLNGQANNVEIPFIVEFSGQDAASPVGNTAVGSNAFGTHEVSLTAGSNGSCIIALNQTNTSTTTTDTLRAGWTGLTFPASPSATGDKPYAMYKLNNGAAGSKTVGWDNGDNTWSITAFEIKSS